MKIPVVLGVNSAYTRQATVVMHSAIVNAKSDTVYNFFVLSHDVTQSDLQYMCQYVQVGDCRHSVQVVYIDDADYYRIHADSAFGRESSFRLFLSKLLPDIKKCIYLDGDTMVVGDLQEMFAIDIGDKAYAACSEKRQYLMGWNPIAWGNVSSKLKFFAKHGFDILDDKTHYTNAGVMLINSQYWQQHDYTERALNFIDSNKDDQNFSCYDQDALNFLAWQDGFDSRVYMDRKYNMCDHILLQKFDASDCMQQAHFRVAGYDGDSGKDFVPIVIHYAGYKKPWDGGNQLMADKYKQYASQVGWVIKANSKRYIRNIIKTTMSCIVFVVPHGIVKLAKKSKPRLKALLKKILPSAVIRKINKFV